MATDESSGVLIWPSIVCADLRQVDCCFTSAVPNQRKTRGLLEHSGTCCSTSARPGSPFGCRIRAGFKHLASTRATEASLVCLRHIRPVSAYFLRPYEQSRDINSRQIVSYSMVAVTWGRPFAVGDCSASKTVPAMPSTLDDAQHPLASPVDVECFNNLSQLFLIASTSYKMLYAPDKQTVTGSTDTRRASAILILEAQLDEWRNDLPPRLQFTSLFDNDTALLDNRTHEKRFLQLL